MGRQSLRHNHTEARIYEERKRDVAEQIREKRFFMGLSQKDVYECLKINPGQYSRIETGELDGARVLKHLENLFDEWKGTEIKRLQAKIKYIRKL